jgi:hypothetical protein
MEKMNRRKFLGAGLAAAASVSLGSTLANTAPEAISFRKDQA